MAGIKISEATLREQLKGTENLPIVDTDLDAGRTTIDNIKDYVQLDLSEYVKNSDIENKVDWTDISTEDDPNRKSIVLANYDTILGTKTDGDTVNVAMVSKLDKVDLGSAQVELNLNGSAERPTYNNDSELALTSDIPDTSNFTIATIEGTNGKSIMQNESTGCGPKFWHNDGTESYVGVNDGGEDGMVAQIYADKETADGKWEGSVINVYRKGIYYHQMRNTGDESYSGDDPDREIAVKGDIPNVDDLTTQIASKADKDEIPDTSNFTVMEVSGDNGTSYVWNERSGGGARFVNNDGTTSFVGVNEGGADGIGVQIYDKDNSTNVGTRINVYTKGAYYIPNMSNSDANYTADDPDREIAVKGDIENLATAESLNELSEKVDSLSSAVAPTKVSDLENDLEFVTSSELSEVKTTLEERISILIDRVDALEERIAQFTARITALEEQSNVLYNN